MREPTCGRSWGRAFTVTLAGGVLLALGLGDLILSLVPKPSPTLKYALEIAVGVLLVGVAVTAYGIVQLA